MAFQWMSPKISGEPFNLTAEEWNTLMMIIANLKSSITQEAVFPEAAVPGQPFTAKMYNDAIRWIMQCSGEGLGAQQKFVKPGDPVKAEQLNELVSRVNALGG